MFFHLYIFMYRCICIYLSLSVACFFIYISLCIYVYVCIYISVDTPQHWRRLKPQCLHKKKNSGICGHSLWIWPLLLRNDLQVCQRLIITSQHWDREASERLQRALALWWFLCQNIERALWWWNAVWVVNTHKDSRQVVQIFLSNFFPPWCWA